jgi:myo-inositol-1(or 4)-monophosphatase
LPASDRSAAPAPSLDALAAILREAGTIALKTFRANVRSWTKAGQSPVCEADIAVNDFLKDRLASLGPQIGWLSEESVDDSARLDAASVWIVDPIDGTRAYIAGLEDWSISVALVKAGRPVVAGLYAPVTNELFLAQRDLGATCNGKTLAVTDAATLAGARVGGPRNRVDRLARVANGIVPAPKIHSLALRFARVAQGRLDVVVAGPNSHDWDLAAADLLVHEAGGLVTDLAGAPVIYNRSNPVHGILVAAGPARLGILRGLLREHADAI